MTYTNEKNGKGFEGSGADLFWSFHSSILGLVRKKQPKSYEG